MKDTLILYIYNKVFMYFFLIFRLLSFVTIVTSSHRHTCDGKISRLFFEKIGIKSYFCCR